MPTTTGIATRDLTRHPDLRHLHLDLRELHLRHLHLDLRELHLRHLHLDLRELHLLLAGILIGIIASAGCPGRLNAQNPASPDVQGTGTLAGSLLGRDDAAPVPYGTVTIIETGDSRFADPDGHFRIGRIIAGTYTVRARQIGYAPTDTTVRIDSAPAVTTVTLHLARLAPLLEVVKVQGRHSKDCVATGIPDPRIDPGLAATFAQVEENVARFRLLWDEYPFHYTRERVTLLRLDPGGSTIQRTETANYESRSQRAYHVGEVVHNETDESGETRRVMYLPTFRDLADTNFLAAHCFSFGGEEQLSGTPSGRVLRLDFKPARAIASPDVEGSIFLDPARLIVRRAVFRLTKPGTLDPPVVAFSVTSTYRELIPLVPVLDTAIAVQPMPHTTVLGPHLGEVTRTVIEQYRLTDYQFESRKPGDQ
jgi:hypothetical protein